MKDLGKKQWILGVVALAAILLRTLQKTTFINLETGFFTDSDLWMLPLWAILLIGVFFLYQEKKYTQSIELVSLPSKSILLGLASILLGLAVEFSSYVGIIDIIDRFGEVTPKLIFSSISTFFGIISGLCFLLLGVFYLIGKPYKRRFGILLSLGVFWQIPYLIERFSSYTSIRAVSDQQLFVVFLVANLFFILSHAKVACKDELQKEWPTAVFYGGLVALLGAVFFLPTLLTPGAYPIFHHSEKVVVVAFSIYGEAYRVTLLHTAKGAVPSK